MTPSISLRQNIREIQAQENSCVKGFGLVGGKEIAKF